MNKKTAIKLMLGIIVLAGLIISYFLFFYKDSNDISNFLNEDGTFGTFFPTGEPDEDGFFEGAPLETENTQTGGIIPRLRKLSSEPVSGFVIFNRIIEVIEIDEDGEEIIIEIPETVFRFTHRATGHILETISTNLETKRISNTTIPRNYKSYFSANGNYVAMQTLDQNGAVRTFVAEIEIPENEDGSSENQPTQEAQLSGSFIPISIQNFDTINNKFLYSVLVDDQRYGSLHVLYEAPFADPNDSELISSSKLTELTYKWLNENTIYEFSNPSLSALGFLNNINVANGNSTRIVSDVAGLNPIQNSDFVLYSESTREGISSHLFYKDSKVANQIAPTIFAGDKCVFSKQDSNIVYCATQFNYSNLSLPDLWYMGMLNFNDSIYRINLETLAYTPVLTLNQENSEIFDVINLQLSPDEDFLLFQNKRDLNLWSLDIL